MRRFFPLAPASFALAGGLLLVAACGQDSTAPLSSSDPQGSEVQTAANGGGSPIFTFNQLISVPKPFTGETNAIRGIPGGGLPWVVDRGTARLDRHGELRVEVQGLVLDPHDADVIAAGLAGNNPVPEFKAILSCLTVHQGSATTVNVETDLFPATTGVGGGDAKIRQRLTGIPEPCIAPIMFVASPGGMWLAASGF